jgi:WD40 repeat protein
MPGQASCWPPRAATSKPEVRRAIAASRCGDLALFSPDGLRVVTASADETARVWDAATGKPVASPSSIAARC